MKRFDKKGKGRLTVDDYYNVIKVCRKLNKSFFSHTEFSFEILYTLAILYTFALSS